MSDVMIKLEEHAIKASEAEGGVIRYILKNPEIIIDTNINQLAQKTFSSSATIVRLCKKLGFRGYKEFHNSLLCEIAMRKSSQIEFSKSVRRDDSLEDIIQKVTVKNINSLEATKKIIDRQVMEECVNLIECCRKICLFGVGASLLVAKDAYLKFLRVNKECAINDDFHAQLLEAQNMESEDLAIIISYSGLTVEMIKCAKIIKEIKAPIIAITMSEISPIAKLADYNLWVAKTESIFREGAISSRISQLNLIDILYTAYINKNYESNLDQINRTHIKK